MQSTVAKAAAPPNDQAKVVVREGVIERDVSVALPYRRVPGDQLTVTMGLLLPIVWPSRTSRVR